MIVAFAACSLSGLRRGRPRCPVRTPGTASRVAASIRLSWPLAPVSLRPGGVPFASTTRWRFVPGLPRSAGLGPVAVPPFWLALARAARDQSSASASCSRSSITRCSAAQTPAACHAPSRLQLVLPLQPITARGRCFHCMPVRRTGMMPANAARSQRAADHPSASRARAAEAAQPPLTDRRARERRCCLNPRRPVLSRALKPEGSIKRCAWADHSSSSISGCVRQKHSRGSGPCSRFHSPARLQSPRIRAERSTSKW